MMNSKQIENLKILISQVDAICLHIWDYNENIKFLKEKLSFSPFSSNMMYKMVKKGIVGRFQKEKDNWDNASYCILIGGVEKGHVKILYSSLETLLKVNNDHWKNNRWSDNINLEDDMVKHLDTLQRIKSLKSFW